MYLSLPQGYSLYGGAQFSAVVDGDNKLFFSCCCANKSEDFFGNAVFVARTDGVVERVQLPETYKSGRGHLFVYAGQLYYVAEADGQLCFQNVPGFTPVAQTVTSLPPIQLAAVALDPEARRLANESRDRAVQAQNTVTEFQKKYAPLSDRVGKLEARPTAQPVNYSDPKLLDVIWSKAGDRIYAEVTNPQSATYKSIADLVWAKAGDRIYAELQNAQSGFRGLLKQVVEAIVKATK